MHLSTYPLESLPPRFHKLLQTSMSRGLHICITMHSLKECPRRTGLPWPGHITYSDMLRSVQLQGEPHRTVLLWHTYTQHADTWSIVPSTRDPECGVRQVLDSYWTSPFACQAGQAQCTAPARRKPALAFLQSGLPLALWSQKKKARTV